MSGPSPGRQEAGAPCTGESLSLPFFSFFPLPLQTLISLERGGSEEVSGVLGDSKLLTKGNLVSSR